MEWSRGKHRPFGPEGRKNQTEVQREIAQARDRWLKQWTPLLTSNQRPMNPYRVIRDLDNTLDRENSIVTHDAGQRVRSPYVCRGQRTRWPCRMSMEWSRGKHRPFGPEGRKNQTEVQREIAQARDRWLKQWTPLLTSNQRPMNPYRVIRDLDNTLDRENSIVTHDAGHPRDQMMPFYTATAPHSYIGWGKTTHLGYGIGLMIGAKIAHPDKFCLNVMGDAAFGQAGLDIETAVRAGTPITTVVINNHGMGGYPGHMPTAYELYGASALSGDYAKVAEGLGAVGIHVNEPDSIVPAVKRAQQLNAEGHTCLIEIATKEENRMSLPPWAGGH